MVHKSFHISPVGHRLWLLRHTKINETPSLRPQNAVEHGRWALPRSIWFGSGRSGVSMDRCFGLRFNYIRALIGGKAPVMSPNQWRFLGPGVFPWVEITIVCHMETSSFQIERTPVLDRIDMRRLFHISFFASFCIIVYAWGWYRFTQQMYHFLFPVVISGWSSWIHLEYPWMSEVFIYIPVFDFSPLFSGNRSCCVLESRCLTMSVWTLDTGLEVTTGSNDIKTPSMPFDRSFFLFGKRNTIPSL
jgi:hypothetical protein